MISWLFLIIKKSDYQQQHHPSSRGTGTGSQSKNIVMHHGISKMIAGMDRGPRRGFMRQALEGDPTHIYIFIYLYMYIYIYSATGQ